MQPSPKLLQNTHGIREKREMLDFQDRISSFKSLNVKTRTETTIFKVSMLRLRPRLKFWKYQTWDRYRDWNLKSLKLRPDTENEIEKVSMLRLTPRLQISKVSKPRIIETREFGGCRDQTGQKLLRLRLLRTNFALNLFNTVSLYSWNWSSYISYF